MSDKAGTHKKNHRSHAAEAEAAVNGIPLREVMTDDPRKRSGKRRGDQKEKRDFELLAKEGRGTGRIGEFRLEAMSRGRFPGQRTRRRRVARHRP